MKKEKNKKFSRRRKLRSASLQHHGWSKSDVSDCNHIRLCLLGLGNQNILHVQCQCLHPKIYHHIVPRPWKRIATPETGWSVLQPVLADSIEFKRLHKPIFFPFRFHRAMPLNTSLYYRCFTIFCVSRLMHNKIFVILLVWYKCFVQCKNKELRQQNDKNDSMQMRNK